MLGLLEVGTVLSNQRTPSKDLCDSEAYPPSVREGGQIAVPGHQVHNAGLWGGFGASDVRCRESW